MANEQPMDATQQGSQADDEFAVRLGWADGNGGEEPGGSLHVVDEWGGPWVDSVAADPEDDATAPPSEEPGASELRRIQTALLGLRSDVAALRRAARESTELQELGLNLAELRAEVAELLELEPLAELRADIAALRSEVSELSQRSIAPLSVSVLAPLVAEIGELRADLVALKHRTALRASPPPERSAEDADLIARRVAEHLAPLQSKRQKRP
jgi:hypothetical protein